MKVTNLSLTPKKALNTPLFTAPDVTAQTLVTESEDYNVNMINFGRGVRNKFHAHDHDQVLIVTSGRGFVATESKKIPVSEGDVILVSSGEKHWHGAAEDSEFSHYSITRKGSKMEILEDE